MKTQALALFALLVSAFAVAGESAVQISVGRPKHTKASPRSEAPGSAQVEFPIRVTNTSQRSVWFGGYRFRDPFYGLFTREAASATWADRSAMHCGLANQTFQLAPGTSTTFEVVFPARYIGQQFRVELHFLHSPKDSTWVKASSDATSIK